MFLADTIIKNKQLNTTNLSVCYLLSHGYKGGQK